MGSLRAGAKWFKYGCLVGLGLLFVLGPASAFAQSNLRSSYHNRDYHYVQQPVSSITGLNYYQNEVPNLALPPIPHQPEMFGTVYHHEPGQIVGGIVSYPDGWQQRRQQNNDPLDPSGDLRSQQARPRVQEPEFDPSPDPPVEDIFRQTELPPQEKNGDPFSDDRAIMDLREAPLRLPQETEPHQPQPRRTVPSRPERDLPPTRVNEEMIRRWENPPDMLIPENRSNVYQRQQPAVDPVQPRATQPAQPPSHRDSHPSPLTQGYPPHHYDGQSHGYSPGPDQINRYRYPLQYPSEEFQIQSPYESVPQDAHRYQTGPHQLAGERSFFSDYRRPQWGVAGYEELACGVNAGRPSDCGFDCGAPTFYLKGYGASVDLRNLVSGINTLLTDNGGGFGFALGQRQGRNLRTELEYSWRSNSIVGLQEGSTFELVTGKIRSQAGMSNAIWEFVNFPHRHWKPYVGAGLGFARIDTVLNDSQGQSITLERSKDSSFAYQFMGGINYQCNRYMDLYIEYRLFQADSFAIETSTGQADGRYDYRTNNLIGGLSWKF
jgi:opacity protein-like surface antigen